MNLPHSMTVRYYNFKKTSVTLIIGICCSKKFSNPFQGMVFYLNPPTPLDLEIPVQLHIFSFKIGLRNTTFIMTDCLGRMVTTNTKVRPERPRASCICNMATVMAAHDSTLTEEDIPGTSLRGRKPSELKNKELKFWLQHINDPAKSLKTKAELVKR